MNISRIQKTKQGRFSLFDEAGEFLFSVDGETLLQNNICEDTVLSDEELAALRAQSDTRKAKDKALTYLSLRDYASGELYDKLCQRFDAHTAAAAVADMARLGLLDDEAFARHRAAYLAGQNKSAREIAHRLAEKGIARETIAAVLEELAPAGEEACYALVQKSYLSKLRAGKRENVIAALARRGFSYGDIKAALARCALEEEEE